MTRTDPAAVTALKARVGELKALVRSLADKLATASEHLTRVAERRAAPAKGGR